MKKALIIGIDYYDHVKKLNGCVNDSYDVKKVFERHGDGTRNFDVKHIPVTDTASKITRRDLKDLVEELYRDDCEIALFYFSGHGFIESTGGYLITSECTDGDDGFALNDLLQIANESPSKSKVIIIDSCHSGIMGNTAKDSDIAKISEGLTILTASSADQYAMEKDGSGIFTKLLVDSLSGGAANLIGEISPGGVYAHIDKSLGSWEQRPIFKTNVKSFTVLRKVTPSIPLTDLQRIIDLFPTRDYKFPLDPTYEPERAGNESRKIPLPIKEHTDKFSILQKMNRINLVIPEGAPHMWHAAMNCKHCKLTTLGEHYWNLVKNNRI